MRAYLQFILKHRWMVLGIVFVITVLACWQMSRGVFASSMVKLFFGESEKYSQYEKLMEDFGSSDIMVVAWEGMGRALRNPLRISQETDRFVEITSL